MTSNWRRGVIGTMVVGGSLDASGGLLAWVLWPADMLSADFLPLIRIGPLAGLPPSCAIYWH